jgi:hypothetical protein
VLPGLMYSGSGWREGIADNIQDGGDGDNSCQAAGQCLRNC